MDQQIAEPVAAASAVTALSGFDRATEDYLDWAENCQRAARSSRRFGVTLVGIAFTLTAITVATLAFLGF